MVEQRLEALDHFAFAPGRQSARVLRHELELAIEATRVGDFGEPEPHRILERSVALREVVEEADADG